MTLTKAGMLNQFQQVTAIEFLNYIRFEALAKYLVQLWNVNAGTAERITKRADSIKADLVYQLIKRLQNTIRAALDRLLKCFYFQGLYPFLIYRFYVCVLVIIAQVNGVYKAFTAVRLLKDNGGCLAWNIRTGGQTLI